MADNPNNLGALDEGDELYKDMPEHVKRTYRRAKGMRRAKQRADYAANRGGLVPGLRSPGMDCSDPLA